MSKSRKALMKLIYIALFTALCFVGTMIFIPIGTSKMHLGNLFCILAGLLCGGWVGGIAGALGMGLNDIVFGYPYTVYVRTFILKFLMGFISGTLFRALIKHHVKGNLLLYITSSLLSALYIYIVVCYCNAVKGFTLTLLIVSSSGIQQKKCSDSVMKNIRICRPLYFSTVYPTLKQTHLRRSGMVFSRCVLSDYFTAIPQSLWSFSQFCAS